MVIICTCLVGSLLSTWAQFVLRPLSFSNEAWTLGLHPEISAYFPPVMCNSVFLTLLGWAWAWQSPASASQCGGIAGIYHHACLMPVLMSKLRIPRVPVQIRGEPGLVCCGREQSCTMPSNGCSARGCQNWALILIKSNALITSYRLCFCLETISGCLPRNF